MLHHAEKILDEPVRRALREWKSLVAYKLFASLLSATILGPLALAAIDRWIGLFGEGVLGNWDLLGLFHSPSGLALLVASLGLALALAYFHYAGLIVLADAALRSAPISTWAAIVRVTAAGPRLLALGLLQASMALAASLPFLAAAALLYRTLLSDADIHYFLSARPPRFWLAVAAGLLLAAGWAAAIGWFALRWGLAVPACVLEGQTARAALAASSRLAGGRVWRWLDFLAGWFLLWSGANVAAVWGLDQLHRAPLAAVSDRLTVLVWSTAAVLLVDSIVLQLVEAIFAIGLSVAIAVEYERIAEPAGRRSPDRARGPSGPCRDVPWRTRAAILAIAAACPLLAALSTIGLASELVEHRPVRVTAHRAGPDPAPENSLAALTLAIRAGADDVEIDVQLTSDGQVVLMHDRDLRRMTGDPRVVTEAPFSFISELRLLGAPPFDGETVPTLSEFLGRCGEAVRVNIELKDFGRAGALASKVLAVLREQKFLGRAFVTSFEPALLAELKSAEPSLPVGAIFSAAKGDVTRLPVDLLSLHQRMVQPDLVRRAHRLGMEVHAWSVGDRETVLRLLDVGCDNLITRDPAAARAVVSDYAALSDVERLLLRIRRWLRR